MLVLTRKIPADAAGRADNVLVLTVPGLAPIRVTLCGLSQAGDDGVPQCKVLIDAPKAVGIERPDAKNKGPKAGGVAA